jgi:hypothetical protein
VNSTPLWSSRNRFACLSVEEIHEPSVTAYDYEKAVPDTPPSPLRRPRIPRWERRLPRWFVIASTPSTNSLDISIEVETTDTNVKHATKALVDCGATGLFMDTQWAQDNNITTCSLTHPIPVYNVDGSSNETGPITEVADVILCYANHTERALFAVTKLGRQNAILGFSWLCQHNPEINWQTGEVHMSQCT